MANEVPTPTTPAAAKPRVLVADTSRSVRAVIGSHLRDRFEVREAEDGEAAWQSWA